MLNIEDIQSAESYLLYGLAPSGGDDTPRILAEALENQYEVRLGPGTFNIVSNLRVNYPIKIIGAGKDKTLVNCINATYGGIVVDSGAAGTQLDGVYFADMTLDGHIDTLGFEEHRHIININGVKNCTIERVGFRGFRGDGIYVGSGPDGGQERHNTNIRIRNSHFDGVTNTNRNAISVIDCDGLWIEHNEIKNCSDPTMPGAIDVEPNSTFNVLRKIRIWHNTITNCTGGVGCIAVALHQSYYLPDPTDIVIAFNTIDTGRTSNGIGVTFAGASGGRDQAIVIAHNSVKNTRQPLTLMGVVGARVVFNNFEDSDYSCYVGYSQPGVCIDVTISHNVFKRLCSLNSGNGTGILVYEVLQLDFLYNRFVDCGREDATGGIGVDFRAGYADAGSSYVSFVGNVFRAPLSRMKHCIHNTGHTWAPATNICQLNRFNNIPWDFAFPGIDVPSFASAPAYKKGALYFNSTANKLYIGGAAVWEAVSSS